MRITQIWQASDETNDISILVNVVKTAFYVQEEQKEPIFILKVSELAQPEMQITRKERLFTNGTNLCFVNCYNGIL